MSLEIDFTRPCDCWLNTVDGDFRCRCADNSLPWKEVVFADECIYQDWDDDRECPECPKCHMDYSECPCPGPTQDDEYEYKEFNGKLYARAKLH